MTNVSFGQSIDIESEKYPGTKKLIVKSYNGCCAKKGFKAIYYFDNNGRTIKSSNFFKRQLRASYEYLYNDNGLLSKEILVYDINNKSRKDTTKYFYEVDTTGKVLSKQMTFGLGNRFSYTDYFKEFNELGLPKTVIRVNDRKEKTIIQRTYDSIGNITKEEKVENDTLITLEERNYNQNGHLIYSILPSIVGVDKKGLAIFIGGSRYSAIEKYEYTYDVLNRWTEKYIIYDDKKILHQMRIYK
jgi:hypothetical protein